MEILFWAPLLALGYAYLLYPVLLLIIDRIHKPISHRTNEEELPKVSVIVPAYNEEKVIRKRIENLLDADYPSEAIEIIIASDGSNDRTNSIVVGFADRGIRLLAYSERGGKVNVLNKTVPLARHDIIVFTDANTMFERDAIKKLVRHFADTRIGCVCGELRFVNVDGSTTGELESVYWRFETLMKRLEGRRRALLGANGGIFAIRKELFVPLPSDTIVEDFLLPMKILQNGKAVIYEPHAQATEEAAHKISEEKERRIRIGAGDFQALFRLWPMLNPLKGFPALAFFSHKVLRWFAPFLMVLVFFANCFLLGPMIYNVIFFVQCVFYLFAFAGQVLNKAGRYQKFLHLCYYFMSMNTALLIGFYRYVTDTQNVMWDRTER